MNARILLLSLIALLATVATLPAQTARVGCLATVVTPASAMVTDRMSFGGTEGKGSGSRAALTLSGGESDDIVVSIPGSVTLTSVEGKSLSVAIGGKGLLASKSGSVSGASLPEMTDGSTMLSLSDNDGGNGRADDGLGQLYLWVDGAVKSAPVQDAGTYSGTLVVSASYSN
ncbi:MAG: hypothetical protein JWQ98_1791 [Chlorobi bacterium]|nr:hypothetical protein [Chlorobiota bacterium]